MAKSIRPRPGGKRLHQNDLDHVVVRVLGSSAREKIIAGRVGAAKHADKRRKPPRHKRRPEEET